MNRHERRATRKRSRDATDDEIFGEGIGNHGPLQPDAAAGMRAVMDKVVPLIPGYDVALFLIEKPERAVGRLPRFNYAATVDRADMIAVLRAFIAKQEAGGAVLDRIADKPPTQTRQ